MAKLTQPLKWHGGKHYLAPKIVALMPLHTHYVEPYFGGGSVLLAKDPQGVSEVVNDRSRELTNFWRVLQSEEKFAEFLRVVSVVPFSQVEWDDAGQVLAKGDQVSDVEQAVAFFIRCRLSRAGKMASFATLSKSRTRRAMNEQAAAWMGAVEGLPAVVERMRRVVIYCDNALQVIKSEDSAHTLFYLDPPYLHETRVTTADYAYEMSEDDHRQLLEVIGKVQGQVMLSGYPSEMYDNALQGWHKVDFPIDNKASSAKSKPLMVERLWMNFEPKRGVKRDSKMLFH